MKGQNRLVLNQATMTEAAQHYLKNVLFSPGHCPVVVRVEHKSGLSGTDVFEVVLDDPLGKEPGQCPT